MTGKAVFDRLWRDSRTLPEGRALEVTVDEAAALSQFVASPHGMNPQYILWTVKNGEPKMFDRPLRIVTDTPPAR